MLSVSQASLTVPPTPFLHQEYPAVWPHGRGSGNGASGRTTQRCTPPNSLEGGLCPEVCRTQPAAHTFPSTWGHAHRTRLTPTHLVSNHTRALPHTHARAQLAVTPSTHAHSPHSPYACVTLPRHVSSHTQPAQ